MDIVYFVYATLEDGKEIQAGVWLLDIRYICSQFKQGGGIRFSLLLSRCEGCLSIRVVERIWAEPEDGSPPKVISENIYDQKDMRRLDNLSK